MAETNEITCLLGRKPWPEGDCPRMACPQCGWNPREMAKRDAAIAARGLDRGEDGLRRLVLPKRPKERTTGNTNGKASTE